MYFIGEETKTKEGEMTYPMSHFVELKMQELRHEPRCSDLLTIALLSSPASLLLHNFLASPSGLFRSCPCPF